MTDVSPNSVEAVPDVVAPTKSAPRRSGRRNSEVLGLAWLHGSLQATVFRRQATVSTWVSAKPVRTLEEWETGLDLAIEQLKFGGSEVFLILEHDQFVHQPEVAPAFTESATRAYLRSRVQRFEKEREPVLWISQRTVSTRKESTFLLHMLPAAFYGQLSRAVLARRLDLTRILPLVVPLQLLLESPAPAPEQMVLVATEAGDATTLMVARSSGELLFARTMLARWDADPARIAVEVNRSLLYAKQQFGAVVDRIEFLGSASEQLQAEVRAKCGPDKPISVRPTDSQTWLQAVAKLSPRHPVNLVVSYLGRKRRRQFLRRALLAACWLGLALTSLDAWTTWQTFESDRVKLVRLQRREAEILKERDELRARSKIVANHRELIRQVAEDKLPPVAVRFLSYLGGIRAPEMQFTDYAAKWDASTGGWTFKIDGLIEGDEETAKESLTAFERTVEKSPLRARFNESTRVLILMPAAGPDAAPVHRFTVEGGLFEN
jgi:hypothetical protein